MRRVLATLSALLVAPTGVLGGDFAELRRRLVEEIRLDVRLTGRELGRSSLEARVLEVIGRVPRHEFVPADLQAHAYENRPLAIGYGQTISQPYIVAIMTDLLDLGPGASVLEIGTGSAYQAAVLAELVERVFTVEIIPQLGEAARARLERLGYRNVSTRIGDGYYGWEEEAPFDGIMVTAAASHIPPPLIAQLKPGGRMIIPVGEPFSIQHLVLLRKLEDGSVRTRQVLPVAFVPLTGRH